MDPRVTATLAESVLDADVDVSSRRPVWLLDVDGVINCYSPGWLGPYHEGEAYAGRGRPYEIRWAPELIAKIREMHASGRVEIRWCTTWCNWAEFLEDLLGLPRFERAFTWHVGCDRAVYNLKQGAALAVVRDEGRPLIWTDDDAIPAYDDLPEELRGPSEEVSTNVLLVRPRGRYGLTQTHITVIEGFVSMWLDINPEA